MLGAFRPAEAGPRGAAARIGLAALLACIGLSWTAGATDAFATDGTVKITKVNEGGDPADSFRFDSSTQINYGGFDLKGGQSFTSTTVHANAGYYDAPAYTVSEPANDKYELKSIYCTVTAAYDKRKYGSTTPYGANAVKIKVGVHEKVACTFTNKRKTGTIVVKKQLAPATDAGRFDLQVDGKNVATQVGDGGYGSATVPTGTHKVGEAGANLESYLSYTTCTKPNGYVVAKGSGLLDVDVASGDTITCTIENTRKAKIVVEKHTAPADTGAYKTQFGFTMNPGAISYDLADGDTDTRYVEPGKAYTIAEADPHAKGYKLTALYCTSGTTNVETRTAVVTPDAGETVTCSYTNTKLQPGIEIVKSGPAKAYSGDTLDFGFDVSNTGERPLHDIDVHDDRCSPVEGPVAKEGGNDDDVLDPGETWHYTCSYVATHALSDPNPVTNTATVQGYDDEGTKVEDYDTHDTLFLHPAIDIAKSGPATATAGALLTYTLDVTNPGDMPFAAADVAVTDAKCDAAPVLKSTNGDETPDVLNPGDKWTYTCSVKSAVGQTSVVNVADVEGTDEYGKVVTGEDTFTTTLTQPKPPSTPKPPSAPKPPSTPKATPPAPVAQPAPAQAVAGVKTVSHPARGTAAFQGPRACPRSRSVSASVRGRQIRRVTFFVRGHKVKTVTKAENGRWTLTLRTSSLRRGANAVTARVEFTAASGTKARTLRITITRCAAQVLRPQFTG
jgi:hypothetical protein